MKEERFITQNNPSRYYSESFKKMVVSEVERGFSKDSVKRKYNLGGKTTVLNWCRKYGKLNTLGLCVHIKMNSEQDEKKLLKQRVSELERALSDAHLKLEAQKIMMDLAESKYHIDIRKNFGAKQPR